MLFLWAVLHASYGVVARPQSQPCDNPNLFYGQSGGNATNRAQIQSVHVLWKKRTTIAIQSRFKIFNLVDRSSSELCAAAVSICVLWRFFGFGSASLLSRTAVIWDNLTVEKG